MIYNMDQDHSQEVARHYDRNTRRFLAMGQHAESNNIHQPLWPPGVKDLRQASTVSNDMVLQAARDLIRVHGAGIQILDLGCGVGSTAMYMGNRLGTDARICGITISGEQVRLARNFVKKQNLNGICTFEQGDFLDLSNLEPAHLIYAIEAFLHGPDPEAFFREVSSQLLPGGTLILIDDFLTENQPSSRSVRARHWLHDFRKGWLAGSLLSVSQAEALALSSGLKLSDHRDLTPWMKLGRPRDQMIGFARLLVRKRMQESTYWRALSGGYAKQQCLRRGILSYRYLAFEKA